MIKISKVIGFIILVIGIIIMMNLPYTITRIITKGAIDCHEIAGAPGARLACFDKSGEKIDSFLIPLLLLLISLSLTIGYFIIFVVYYPKILKKQKK